MIAAFTGNLGTGKTYCLVSRALGEVKRRRPIFTNMNVSWGVQFTDWRQLLGLSNGLVLIDEAGSWFNAREWKDSPREVFSWMTQSRKQGLSLWYTCQHLSMVDKTLRLLTNIEYRHERWWGNLIRERGHDTGTDDILSSRWYRINKRVYAAYDTNEIVGDGKDRSNASGRAGVRGAGAVGLPLPDGGASDVWAIEEARRCLVREDYGGVVRYRQATAWDVVNGADLVPRIVAA